MDAMPPLARRFVWSSYLPLAPAFQALLDDNLEQEVPEASARLLPARETARDVTRGDAFETLMEWLYGRLVAWGEA